MERLPQIHNKLDKKYLEIDNQNLESQLSKTCEVLTNISENNSFSTFIHFEKFFEFSKMPENHGLHPVEVLKKWDYDSSTFIEKEKNGNCVDFAILAQKKLNEVGVPTTVIGKIPDENDFTPSQVKFMKYRHVSLLYTNEGNTGLESFLFEPGWKFPAPIAIKSGVISTGKDWQFETTQINGTEFTQKAYHLHKKKYSERKFATQPLSSDFCTQIAREIIRIPRKFEMVNRLDKNSQTYFLKFDHVSEKLATNIPGIEGNFLPDSLSAEQAVLIDTIFETSNLKERLIQMLRFREELPDDFWIK